MKNIHIYQFRHVFADDDCIGKYDANSYTVRIFEEFAEDLDPVLAFFRGVHGINAKGLVGKQELMKAVPLLEFPPEIAEKIHPQLGDMTPAVVNWARANWPEDVFSRRYQGRADYSGTSPAPVVVPFLGGAVQDSDDDDDDGAQVPGLLDALTGGSGVDDDWKDESEAAFRSVKVDPSKNDGATGAEPLEPGEVLDDVPPSDAPPVLEVTGETLAAVPAGFERRGDDIFQGEKKIASFFEDGTQLRMASGHAGDRKAVEAFLNPA